MGKDEITFSFFAPTTFISNNFREFILEKKKQSTIKWFTFQANPYTHTPPCLIQTIHIIVLDQKNR